MYISMLKIGLTEKYSTLFLCLFELTPSANLNKLSQAIFFVSFQCSVPELALAMTRCREAFPQSPHPGVDPGLLKAVHE